jgi:hypothetical protein
VWDYHEKAIIWFAYILEVPKLKSFIHVLDSKLQEFIVTIIIML